MSEDISDGYHTFGELYAYRAAYHAALLIEWHERGLYDVHKSRRHSDGEECFGGGWFIVMATLPTGQISNHYPDSDWEMFDIPEYYRADKWDGHTPADCLIRIRNFIASKG